MKELEDQLKNASNIVFICSGNIIRSAFAEIFMNHFNPNFGNFYSVGTTYFNTTISIQAASALKQWKIPDKSIKTFTSTHISNFHQIIDNATVFIGMTNNHLADVKKYYHTGNYYLMSEIIDEQKEIEDPYFTSNFVQVFEYISKCLKRLSSIINSKSIN